MTILDQLSSRRHTRSEDANRRVADACLAKPALLDEIAAGLQATEAALVGDCAEVLTMVAGKQPEQVAPYAAALAGLLAHKTTRVRWEAMHALALVADCAPKAIAPLLPRLGEILKSDGSTIVRDYAADAVANYAGTGRQAALKAMPILREALEVWEGKHARHALDGLALAAAVAPNLRAEIKALAENYLDDRRGVVRKAAKRAVQEAETG